MDSGSSGESDGLKYSRHFAGDLLHPYFRANRRLLTVSEVAERLGVCVATVYRICQDGSLRHSRVMNAIRVAPEWLDAYVAGRLRGQLHKERTR